MDDTHETKKEEDQCTYCWDPNSGHSEGCPVVDPVLIDEWQRGHDYGFADNLIQWWQRRYYSKPFLLGWQVGKNEIDRLVERAYQSCYGREEMEY